jgi:acid phosphatase type 7
MAGRPWSAARLCGCLVLCVAALGAAAQTAGADPVLAGAGDISCGTSDASFNGGIGAATRCRQKYTSDLLVAGAYDSVFTLGDNVNASGSLSDLVNAYGQSWGRMKAITHPSSGNHEGSSATGYCTYFGAAAHCNASGTQTGAGFYSWDAGTWHVVVLNSNCTAAGGCGVRSPQYVWLQRDLAAHPTACTLAYWHHPRFSSGHDGSNTFMQPIWKLIYDNGADVVLSGHSHDYERFAPMDGQGNLNRGDGMRQFVVGTGGAFFTGFGTVAPNSEVRNNTTFGIVALTLHPSSYDWRFVPEAGKTFTDVGTSGCRGAGSQGADTQPPSAPGLSATAVGPSRVDLSWGASTDNVGVVGYELWRGPAGGTTARIATTAATVRSFSDTGVGGGQRYDYEVRARDAAGNVSAPSNRVTVPTPPAAGGSTLMFAPVADASVKQASPATNFGSSSGLNSDTGSGVAMESYLRFTVAGVGSGAVQAAKLRLFVPSDGTADGPGIYQCSDPACATWAENAITWNTCPPRATTPVADAGRTTAGTWVEWDVTPLIRGDGTYTLTIGPTPTTDGVIFMSRQASTDKPQLVVTTG